MAHNGVIKSVSEGTLTIEICQTEACSACNARSMCNARSKNKEITIDTPDAAMYHIGDTVTVSLGKHAGKRAVLYAYVLPVLLLTVTLALAIMAGMSQEAAALASLGAVIIYFVILYLSKDKIKEHIKFHIVNNK